jgi:hypothetical protein
MDEGFSPFSLAPLLLGELLDNRVSVFSRRAYIPSLFLSGFNY